MGGATMALAQDDTAPVLMGVADVEFVQWVTGPDSPNQTDVNYGVLGTDLGSMFDLNGTTYIAFGDTFGCCRPANGGGGGGQWRYNVLGYSTDHDLDDGMTLDDMIFVDGETWPPALHGTGTEDYFNAAWCPAVAYNSPYHGITLPGGPNWSG